MQRRAAIIDGVEALKQTTLISVDDYLAGELESDIRHEYLNGVVYAMAGSSDNHNAIILKLCSALDHHLSGGRCRVQMIDAKVRIAVADDEIFYYPDIMVLCDRRDSQDYFKRYPKVVVEVLSPSTESIDRRERFLNYRRIETLEEYVLVAQDKLEVTVFARGKLWQPEILTERGQVLSLPSLNFQMPLAEVYSGATT